VLFVGSQAVSISRPSALRTDLAVGVPLSEGSYLTSRLRLLTPVQSGMANAGLRRQRVTTRVTRSRRSIRSSLVLHLRRKEWMGGKTIEVAGL
jgi:hypothetical protein